MFPESPPLKGEDEAIRKAFGERLPKQIAKKRKTRRKMAKESRRRNRR